MAINSEDFKKYGEELGAELIALANAKGAEIADKAIGLGKDLLEWGIAIGEAKLAIVLALTPEARKIAEEDLQYAKMAANNIIARAEIQANTALKEMLAEAFDIALDITLTTAKGLLKAYIPIPMFG